MIETRRLKFFFFQNKYKYLSFLNHATASINITFLKLWHMHRTIVFVLEYSSGNLQEQKLRGVLEYTCSKNCKKF